MKSVHPIAATVNEPASVIGAKAHGLITLRRLGLPVPPGFVIRAGAIPDRAELDAAVADLEAATGLRLGDPNQPLLVSVRSGASVSMPGMMDTILNVAGKPALESAIREVVESWDTPRAKTYRDLHGIPHSLGTAVIVQAMVFGDRDSHSGSGVAFSRNPNTGEPTPYGEVLFGRQGDAVVSGTELTRPLSELDEQVSADLVKALARIEEHYRDACYVEFTFESGELWLLQVKAGGFVGRAAIRVAVDLADSGVITRQEAVLRVSPSHEEYPPTIEATDVLARGMGASPGVATGRIATTSDKAVQMAVAGPVILVRPHTSPLDMHGLAAAAGVVTARGGPTSHAAVVARSMRKPAVVSVPDLGLAEGTLITIDGTTGEIVVGTVKIVTAETDIWLDRLRQWR